MAVTDASPSRTDSTNPDRPAQAAIFHRFMGILTLRSQPWVNAEFKTPAELGKKGIPAYTPGELENILQTLPQQYRDLALVQAAFCGDLSIGKRIIDIHGPIETTLEQRGAQTLLNGEPLHYTWAKNYFRNAKTPADIAQVMEWLPDAGLGWMVGAGSGYSVMFQNRALKDALTHVRGNQFDGELPQLVSGRVECPELLLALHERKDRSHFPKAFDKILCWVDEGNQGDFPDDLVPYKAEQSIHFKDSLRYTRPDQSVTMPISLVSKQFLDATVNLASRGNTEPLQREGLKFDNLKLCTSSTQELINPDSNMLLAHQASESIKHGFWERPGMVLCQTSVDFLKNFELGDQTPKNQIASEAFVHNYAPIDLIAHAYGSKDEEDAKIYSVKAGFDYSVNYKVMSFTNLVSLLDEAEPLRSQVRGILDKDIMSYLTHLNNDSGQLLVSPLPVLYREYGIDNAGLGMSLWASQIEDMHQQGFKFSADTETKFCVGFSEHLAAVGPSQVALSTIGMEEMGEQVLKDTYTKAFQMGLWPTKAKKPETVTEAITALIKRKYNTDTVKGKAPFETNAPIFAYRAFIHDAGVEACVKAVKTPGHWRVLGEVFDTDELKPYLNDAKFTVKAKLFTSDLGM